MRFIAHLDMDAFYASVELLRYPGLRGQPVVVGGRRSSHADSGRTFPTLRKYKGRGVVTTATYEARALGVHSGMGLMKAAKLAPDALLLPADFDEYRRYSGMFKAAVRAIAPEIEDRGIDEIYVDISPNVASHSTTGMLDPWQRAHEVGATLQQAVDAATSLSCSIGVAPNKLLAKLGSELAKPGGIAVLREADLEPRIWPLAVRKVNGIGPKAEAKLVALGINTIGELARFDLQTLVARFGPSYSQWLHETANGRDDRPVVTYSEPKSISRETTFERDLDPIRDRAELSTIFTELCTRVAGDLVSEGYAARKVSLKLRYSNFKTVTRDCTLDAATSDATVIRRAATDCLRRITLDRAIRLLGVRAGSLSRAAATAP